MFFRVIFLHVSIDGDSFSCTLFTNQQNGFLLFSCVWKSTWLANYVYQSSARIADKENIMRRNINWYHAPADFLITATDMHNRHHRRQHVHVTVVKALYQFTYLTIVLCKLTDSFDEEVGSDIVYHRYKNITIFWCVICRVYIILYTRVPVSPVTCKIVLHKYKHYEKSGLVL